MIERVSTCRGLSRNSSSSENSVRVSSIGSPAAPHLARPGVELEVGEAQDVFRLFRRPPQERAHACEQLVERERLRDVVVGARVEPGDTVVHLVARGQHQHGHAVPAAPHAAGDLEPVQSRHQDVEDHHIRLAVHDPREPVGPVDGEIDLVALELQRPPEGVAHGAFVVDHEDPHARIVGLESCHARAFRHFLKRT